MSDMKKKKVFAAVLAAFVGAAAFLTGYVGAYALDVAHEAAEAQEAAAHKRGGLFLSLRPFRV